MGGSLARSLHRVFPDVRITGVDFPAVLAPAQSVLDAAFTPAEVAAAVRDADLVCIATPIGQIESLLPDIAAAMKPGALATDLGSTKAAIVATAGDFFGGDRYFIGGHPMAGSEKGGFENADPFLFENAIYVLTRPAYAPDEMVDRLVAMLNQIGAQVVFLDAGEHDAIAAEVSHIPQLLAVTLTNFIDRQGIDHEARLRLAAGGFRDMTRIATSPYSVWRDILLSNRANIRQGLDQFIAALQELRDQLDESHLPESASGDQRASTASLQTAFERANHLRLRIPRDSRGFLQPYFDITVTAPDEPGIIAKLATTLAQAGVNIKDIEVLKIREGSGGTLRLAFETEATRTLALEILEASGFSCSRRN